MCSTLKFWGRVRDGVKRTSAWISDFIINGHLDRSEYIRSLCHEIIWDASSEMSDKTFHCVHVNWWCRGNPSNLRHWWNVGHEQELRDVISFFKKNVKGNVLTWFCCVYLICDLIGECKHTLMLWKQIRTFPGFRTPWHCENWRSNFCTFFAGHFNFDSCQTFFSWMQLQWWVTEKYIFRCKQNIQIFKI